MSRTPPYPLFQGGGRRGGGRRGGGGRGPPREKREEVTQEQLDKEMEEYLSAKKVIFSIVSND